MEISSPLISRLKPWLLVLLALLATAALAIRLLHFTAPLIRVEEFGSAQFLVYARNYLRYGLTQTRGFPTFSFIGAKQITYSQHGLGGSLLLAAWMLVFGVSEASARGLSLVVSALTSGVLYLLGKELFGARTGYLAAAIYWMLPLSLYLSHIYQMELVLQMLCLVAVWYSIRFSRAGRKRDFAWALILWLVAGFFDTYVPLFFPGLLLVAYLDKSKRKEFLLFAFISPFWQVVYLLYIKACGEFGNVARAGSKYLTPWVFWNFRVGATITERLFRTTAYLTPFLALIGLKRLWQDRQPTQHKVPTWAWILLLACLPVFDLVFYTRALEIHQYRVLFWLPFLSLTSAIALAAWREEVIAVLLIALAALTVPVITEMYQATNTSDWEGSAFVRAHTTDRDLLVGVPAHMAFYIDRAAMVPYFYHWAAPGTYPTADSFFKELEVWTQFREYDRIVMFCQFITQETYPINYSRAFEGHPEWKRLTAPGVDPQVWQRAELPPRK